MSNKQKQFIVRRFGIAGDFLYQEGKCVKIPFKVRLKMWLSWAWKEFWN